MNPAARSACPHRSVQRALIDRHFARRITPRGELAMRAHLPDCVSCRHYYERHITFAELSPGRPGMAARLGAGLGIGPADASAHPVKVRWRAAAVAATSACALLLVIWTAARPRQDEFTARGASPVQDRPQVEVYRVTEGATSAVSATWMSTGDELAFAYRNPTGFKRLLVFGVDDTQRIYWFHPAWTDEQADPTAIEIRSGTGPFELPEAISHEIRGARLRIVGLFTNDAVSVRGMEQTIRSDAMDPRGAVRVETVVEVRR